MSGLPRGDRLVELLLGLEALADLEEHLRHPGVERVLRDERLPGGAGLGVPLALKVIGGDQKLGVEDRPLSVGRLRAVGELREVAFPRGDGLGELLLALEHPGDLERRGHAELGRSRLASSSSA